MRDVSNALNNPNNILVLQQTLDSARVTFQNAQKISSDLDDLTGDPAFRENLRDLVNGLSSLVSSTDQLQQQVEVAEALDSLTTAVNNTPKTKSGKLEANQAVANISTKNSLQSASTLQNSKSITQPMPESIARNQLLRRLLQTKTSSSGS